MFLRRRLPSCPTGATMIKSRRKVPAAKTSLLSEQKQRKHEDDELQKAAARGAAFEKCLSRKFTSRVHRQRKEKLTRRKKKKAISPSRDTHAFVSGWRYFFPSLFLFCCVFFLFFCDVRHQRTGVSIPLYGNAVARCRRRLRSIGFRLLWCRSAFLSVVCYGVCVSSASGFCEKFAFVSIFVSPIEVSCLMFGQ